MSDPSEETRPPPEEGGRSPTIEERISAITHQLMELIAEAAAGADHIGAYHQLTRLADAIEDASIATRRARSQLVTAVYVERQLTLRSLAVAFGEHPDSTGTVTHGRLHQLIQKAQDDEVA